MESNNNLVPIEKATNGLAKYTSPVEFFKEFTPERSLDLFEKAMSIELAIAQQTFSLASIKKMYNKEIAIEYIKLWIIDLNEFLGMKRPMTTAQITQTAALIYQSYYALNLADINLIFVRIKRGDFGQLYESINGTKLISYFEIYMQERVQICYNKSYEEHDHFKYSNQRTEYLLTTIKTEAKNARIEKLNKEIERRNAEIETPCQ